MIVKRKYTFSQSIEILKNDIVEANYSLDTIMANINSDSIFVLDGVKMDRKNLILNLVNFESSLSDYCWKLTYLIRSIDFEYVININSDYESVKMASDENESSYESKKTRNYYILRS